MRRVSFDRTISIGDVLQILTLLAALALGFSSIRERLALLEFKTDMLWRATMHNSAGTTGPR